MSRDGIRFLFLCALVATVLAAGLLGMAIERGSKGDGGITSRLALMILCMVATIVMGVVA